MRRSVLIAGSAVTALALVAGGWFAASAFTSPAQWEAQASAPAVKPVLAEVTQGDLVDIRTLGAAIVPSAHSQAVLTPVSDAARSIVTESSITPGTTVKAGAVLVRVNGQPVFAFASTFPFYRDLGVGDTGPDVEALQRNLVALGLLSRTDGEFGAATARAVTALFRDANAAAPTRPATTSTARTDGDADAADAASAAPSALPYLPLSTVAAIPALPAIVSELPAVGADLAEAGTISFAASDAVLRLSLDSSAADALQVGAAAECAVGTDAAAPCLVRRVFTATGTEAGLSGDEVMTWAELTLAEGVLDAALAGERATVRVELTTLASDALLVPAAALAQQSETAGTVLAERDGGTFRTVQVEVVAALNGTIAVTGDLRAGDLLRVDR